MLQEALTHLKSPGSQQGSQTHSQTLSCTQIKTLRPNSVYLYSYTMHTYKGWTGLNMSDLTHSNLFAAPTEATQGHVEKDKFDDIISRPTCDAFDCILAGVQ